MTPKQKANELVDKMRLNDNWGEKCKGECIDAALIAVNEIIKANPHNDLFKLSDISTSINYWELVKQEIEKL